MTDAMDLSILPADRDQRIEAWLALSCGLRLEPEGWPSQKLLAIATKPKPNIAGAQRAITDALKPATDAQLRHALATLSVSVSHYSDGPDAADLQLAVYVGKLKRYPADIALWALAQWPEQKNAKSAKAWPSWSELRDVFLDPASRFRCAILPALQNVRHAASATRAPPSDADIADVRSLTTGVLEQLNAETYRQVSRAGLEPLRERVEKHAADRIARRKAALAALPGGRM